MIVLLVQKGGPPLLAFAIRQEHPSMPNLLKLVVAATLLSASPAFAEIAQKPVITRDCISVSDVLYQRHGSLTRAAGTLSAKITSRCEETARLRVVIGYFNKHGMQTGSRERSIDIAPGAEWRFHLGMFSQLSSAPYSASIIDVQIQQERTPCLDADCLP